MVNKVILIGHVGRDPEVRYIAANTPTTTISLATTENYTDKQGAQQSRTEWHRVVLWHALAQLAEKHIRKGTQLYVEGRLATRSYTDKTGVQRSVTEVVAETVKLLGSHPQSTNE
ncbi:MAG: single-stranded DNA-binding protein [Salinivirgaceae bacterium]|nr:single-stranded DNA-binding protein [Salinivirgaceae bacterium]